MAFGSAGSDRRRVAGIPPKVSRAPVAQATCRPAGRALIPPLTIIAALVTAFALLLSAAAIAPPPLTGAIAPLPTRSTGVMPSPPEAAIADAARLVAGTTVLVHSATLDLPALPSVVALARLTYAPGAEGDDRALPGPLLLIVEAGSLTVQVTGAAQRLPADQATPIVAGTLVLSAGDRLVLPAATPAVFRNTGSGPVVALAAGVFPTTAVASAAVGAGSPLGHPAPGWVEDGSPGATVQPLAGGWMVDLTARAAAMELQRLSLPPGARVSLAAAGAVALAVETGALTMVSGEGLIWLHHPEGGDDSLSLDTEATLLSGDGALLQAGADVALCNAGSSPLQILTLTVAPVTAIVPTPSGAT
jgi:quercetin dioxygenase-like cupin family protein